MNKPRAQLPPNLCIEASAGSGKTWQLTNRYIQILAAGVAPEKILALTFTRKASGEFLDAILSKLCKASMDDAFAQILGSDIQLEATYCSKAYFSEILHVLISSISKINLSTIDSFFQRIVNEFGNEFGIFGDIQLMDDYEANTHKDKVLSGIFSSSTQSKRSKQSLIEAFRLSTLDKEERNIISTLKKHIYNHHQLLFSHPYPEQWGDPISIWGSAQKWPVVSEQQFQEACESLQRSVSNTESSEAAQKEWTAFIEGCKNWAPLMPPPRGLSKIKEKWKDVCAGNAEIKISRANEILLLEEACKDLVIIAQSIIGRCLRRQSKITKGNFHLLKLYEDAYAGHVRSRGLFTHNDALIILNQGIRPTGENSQTIDIELIMQLIAYRMDPRVEHLLIDEFQDTNHTQWDILGLFADEILQDTSRTRSFFYVGDVKQSIYNWRGGDPLLFNQVYKHYQHHIDKLPLSQSWRSGQALLDTVNKVFGSPHVMEHLYGKPLAKQWASIWNDHSSAIELDAYAECTFQRKGDFENLEEKFYHEILSKIKEIDPINRGLSCAILCRKNEEVSEAIRYIRSHSDIPISGELDSKIALDNPIGTAIYSLFKHCLHPSERLYREHLRMTPLEQAFQMHGDTLPIEILKAIHQSGFHYCLTTLEHIILNALESNDSFSITRWHQLLDAARQFDLSGDKSIQLFLDYLKHYKIRERSSSEVIQAMTIHKAKGLDFDIVFIPILSTKTLLEWRAELTCSKHGHHPSWVYQFPNQEIYIHDPELSAHAERCRLEACFDNLCNMYVAMTRAKQGLYILAPELPPRKKAKKTSDMGGFLRASLRPDPDTAEASEHYQSGNPNWYLNTKNEPRVVQEEATITVRPRHTTETFKKATSPSHKHATKNDSADTNTKLRMAQGALQHDALEQVEWLTSITISRIREWVMQQRHYNFEIRQQAWAELEHFLHSDAAKQVFTNSIPEPELWREKCYDYANNGVWKTGRFDRVHLYRKTDKTWSNAILYDFKSYASNETTDAYSSKPYRQQMLAYKNALHKITQLSHNDIQIKIVSISECKIIEFDE